MSSESDALVTIRTSELLRSTGLLLASRRDKAAPVERPRHEGEILAMYGRASSLFDAMSILIRRDHPEEAFMLGRALFSESLRLEELAQASTKGRIALVMGWVDDSWGRIEAVQRGIEKRKTGDPHPKLIERIAELRKQARAYVKRHGVDRLRKFPTEDAMATKQGRQDQLGDYAFSHEFVHGGFAAHLHRYQQIPDGDVPLLALSITTKDPRVSAGVAAFAAKSAALAHQSAAAIFDWPEDASEIQRLLGEVELLAEEASKRPERASG